MLNKEDLRQLSDLLDEKFEANNALLREEIRHSADQLRTELRTEIRQSTDQLRDELRTEIRQSTDQLRDELRTEIRQSEGQLQTEITQMKEQLQTEMTQFKEQLRLEMVQNNVSLYKQLGMKIAHATDQLRTEMAVSNVQINSKLAHIESDLSKVKHDVRAIHLTIEQEIRPQIKLLTEVFMPEADRFSRAANEIDAIKADIDVLNFTVTNHSKQLKPLIST